MKGISIKIKPPIERLRSSQAISEIFKSGQKVQGSFAFVLWVPRPSQPTRFAVCVSRRMGKAIYRNRIKRVLRALTREYQNLIPGETDFVFIPLGHQKQWSTPKLRKEFKTLCQNFSDSRGGTSSLP